MTRKCVVLAVLAFLYPLALAQDAGEDSAAEPSAKAEKVVICNIDGMVDKGVAALVKRAVKEAAGADTLVFVIDTFGGTLDAAIDISNEILDADCNTVAFAKGKAAVSAGAIISYACDDIVMAPGSTLGTSAPVYQTADGMVPAGEKVVSLLRAKMTALAEYRGHNVAIAKAMVDQDIELRRKLRPDGFYDVYEAGDSRPAGPAEKMVDAIADETSIPLDTVKELARNLDSEMRDSGDKKESKPTEGADELLIARGKLLTLSPQEAIDYQVIKATAKDVDEVLNLYSLGHAIREEIVPTLAERVFRFLTNPVVAGILLMLAIGGLYLEVKTPGFGVPGIVSIVAFTLFFGSRYVIGLSEIIDVVLVILGAGLLIVEIFLLPGFGIAGIAGIMCLAVGIFLSLVYTDFSWPQFEWQYEQLNDAVTTLVVAAASLTIFIIATWKILPKTPLYGRIMLQTEEGIDDGFVVQTAAQAAAAVGQEGVALSMLRPAGKGRFGGRTMRVVSRAEYIDRGTPIVIVEAEGNRYVVDKLKERT